VEFASAASPVAVCSFCRSTLAREGQALRRIGHSAELFDDHSPLQLGAAGRWQGVAFSVVGRLQLRYDQGSWNEWHVLFESGRGAWLSEDNGRHVISVDAPAPPDLPRLDGLPAVGTALRLGDTRWDIASVTRARIAAAEGELPWAPLLERDITLVDLRNPAGEVATADYTDPLRPRWAVGRSVALGELALTGLRVASDKTLAARGVECPSCGSALEIRLDSTRSITCHQCKAVVDVSGGVGADLAFYAQDNPDVDGAQPQLPLGASASMALGGPATDWQVVGYVVRCETEDGTDDGEGEQAFWREYLLYSRSTGFAFLVDAEDGWSWTVPLTGAPQTAGDTALWQGRSYTRLYGYGGSIVYVAGEFYWTLERGQTTRNVDYANGRYRLNREQTGQEVTWSAGQTLQADEVARAFKLPPDRHAALRRDAAAFSGGGALKGGLGGWGPGSISDWLSGRWFAIVVMLFMLVFALRDCSDDGCEELRQVWGPDSPEVKQCLRDRASGISRSSRSSGSSWGGYGSGGGGHK
jgi:hypothetical protein